MLCILCFGKMGEIITQSSRRGIEKSPGLSPHRAYRPVHNGSLDFTYLQIIVGQGVIAETGFYFVRQGTVQYERGPLYTFPAIRKFRHDPFRQIQGSQLPYLCSYSLPLFPVISEMHPLWMREGIKWSIISLYKAF